MEGYFGKFKIWQFVKKKNISKENILHFVFLWARLEIQFIWL